MINPSTVPLLDVKRYMGKWFEVAKLPIVYERGCDSATAHYTPNKDGTFTVLNKCYKMGRSIYESKGKAWLDEENFYDPAKLTVAFEENGMEAPYWIHWTDYDRFSIVGGPSGKFAWILSRKEKISQYELDALITYLSMLGYDVKKLIFSAYVEVV